MKKFISSGQKESVHIDPALCCVTRPKILEKPFSSSIPLLLGQDRANKLQMNLIDLNRKWTLDCFSLNIQALYAVAHNDVQELIAIHHDAFTIFEVDNPKFSTMFPDYLSDTSTYASAKNIMNTMINSVCSSALAAALKNNSIILEKLCQTESYVNAESINFKIPIFDFFTSITPPAIAKTTTSSHSKANTQVLES